MKRKLFTKIKKKTNKYHETKTIRKNVSERLVKKFHFSDKS